MTTYFKYKFKKKQFDILPNDVEYLLPQSKKIHRIFDGKNNSKNKDSMP